jgi:hypothetical protein
MKTREKLSSLISKMKIAKEETTRAVAYSEGYLDCIKDLLGDDSNDLNKILLVKYDGKVRGEVYSEILPVLEDLERDEKFNSGVVIEAPEEESSVMHPSDRARSFLERIGRA